MVEMVVLIIVDAVHNGADDDYGDDSDDDEDEDEDIHGNDA